MTSDKIHMPGGNRFDDIRININEAYYEQEKYFINSNKIKVKNSIIINYIKLLSYVFLRKINLYEALVTTGIIREWFDQFSKYWTSILGGRPITVSDFHSLRFFYRMKFQKIEQLNWDDNTIHVQNWQNVNCISNTMQLLFRQALNPVRYRGLWRYLKKDMQVLEFGCALAPMYATWRKYLSHIDVNWTLADIENFPFHYTNFLYSNDLGTRLVKIPPSNLNEPLIGCEGFYDIIIIQEVFEHLHDPLVISAYLLTRLKPGGIFMFDYILSEATGLDTPSGLSLRSETLRFLHNQLDIIEGEIYHDNRSVGFCVGIKK